MCNCGAEKEDNEHYLLHSPKFDSMRADLFCQLSEILALDIDGMNSTTLCTLLLYGSSKLDNSTNRMILDASIYIKTLRRRSASNECFSKSCSSPLFCFALQGLGRTDRALLIKFSSEQVHFG